AVTIATQVCAALTEAHRAGVVHRDIKPGNVIVSPDLHVKVTDFGIARSLGHSALTDVGTILGTAAYLPPEQARGEAATPASDLYSLGILLYQMLTGRPPFEGDTPVAVALRHLDEPVPAPSASTPGVPAGLDRVVEVATAKDPADRYADAAAMAAALRRALSDDPAPTARALTLPAPLPAADADATARVAAALQATRAMPALPPAEAAAPLPARPARPVRAARPQPSARPRTSSAPRRVPPAGWVAAGVAALVLVVGGGMLLAERPDPPRVASGPSIAPGPAATTTGSPTPTRVPTSKAAAPTPEQPTSTPPADEVRLPDGLVGYRAADARQTLEVMGLRVEAVQVRSRADRGQVLATVPGAGASVPAGQTVVLVVSRGGGKSDTKPGSRSGGDALTVPGWIVGSSATDVRDNLPDNLRVTTVSVPSSQPKGTVVATWPGVGEPLADGQLVLLVAGGRGD
ncbi:MAG TPA: protein kinase, partial [Humibacillus xanthopallidus]|nr:protein kinase [Humibacillus xanthopallidus]